MELNDRLNLHSGTFSLIEINKSVVESVEQDQTIRMSSLILLYTLRKNKFMFTKGKIGVNSILGGKREWIGDTGNTVYRYLSDLYIWKQES